MNYLIALSLCLAVDSPTVIKARAVVAVIDARITAAQGPDLPDSKAKKGDVPTPKSIDPSSMKLNLSEQKVVAGKNQYQVTVYKIPGCIPCTQMHKECGNGNDEIALKWVTGNPPAGVPAVFPVSVWTNAKGQVFYSVGRTTLKALQTVIEANDPPMSVMHAAMGSGGQMHGRAQIRAAIDRALGYVKPGTKTKISWKRNGGRIHSLLKKGQQWTHKEIIGDNGRVTVYIDGDQQFQVTKDITLDSIGFAYDLSIDGDKEVLRITPDALLINFNSPENVNMAVGDKVVAIDPITLAWTAISIIRFVVAIMNPDVSLAMGPSVECDALINQDSIKVLFNNDCPSIHVSAWFEFVLQLESVTIAPDLITVDFKPGSFLSRFVKQRTISVVD